MNLFKRTSARALLLAAFLLTGNVAAGPGHDHGDASPAAPAGTVSPRFEAHSDLFEVVGVLGSKELSLLIDRYASNEPVLAARVDVESGSFKSMAQFHADHGDYSVASTAFAKPGSHPVKLTITVGNVVDVLAGNLVVPEAAGHHDHESHGMGWKRAAALAALLAALGIAAWWFIRRRTMQAKRSSHE